MNNKFEERTKIMIDEKIEIYLINLKKLYDEYLIKTKDINDNEEEIFKGQLLGFYLDCPN